MLFESPLSLAAEEISSDKVRVRSVRILDLFFRSVCLANLHFACEVNHFSSLLLVLTLNRLHDSLPFKGAILQQPESSCAIIPKLKSVFKGSRLKRPSIWKVSHEISPQN